MLISQKKCSVFFPLLIFLNKAINFVSAVRRLNSNCLNFLKLPFSASYSKVRFLKHFDFKMYFVPNYKLRLKVRRNWNNFSSRRFLQKTKERIQFYCYETCFCLFFGVNWRHQKDTSKLTDLKFKMDLWSHCFSQNANQKLQGFLPYHTSKDRSTFWCFFGECR